MKNILFTLVSFLTYTSVHAQQMKAPPAPDGKEMKVMTVAEANALNGTAQPTINGIPYSEYKAQQDALKAERERQIKAAAAKPAPVQVPAEPKKEEPVNQPVQKVKDPNIFN